MGAEMNCHKFCDPEKVGQIRGDDILMMSEYILKCQICQRDVVNTSFRDHLDYQHYCQAGQKQSNFYVQCLICQWNSNLPDVFDAFNKHLKTQHTYAVNNSKDSTSVLSVQQAKNRNKKISNKMIKTKCNQIKKSKDFQLINENGSKRALIKGQSFVVLVNQKQYQGMQYSEQSAHAQLVWWPVFSLNKKGKQCRYYYIDEDAKQRSIYCKAYLFLE